MIEFVILVWEFLLDDVIDAKLDSGNFFIELFDEIFAIFSLKWLVFGLMFMVPDISQELVMVDGRVETLGLEFIFVLLKELNAIQLLFKETVFFIKFIELRHEFLFQEFELIELAIILGLVIFGLK